MGSLHPIAGWTPRAHRCGGCACRRDSVWLRDVFDDADARAVCRGVRKAAVHWHRRRPPYTAARLVYVTDRVRSTNPENAQPYTADRARHHCLRIDGRRVRPGHRLGHAVAQSTSAQRSVAIDLRLGTTAELGRFPDIPYEFERTPRGLSRTPAVIAAHEAAKTAFQAELERRLARAPRKEVVVFVHGFANTFEDAVLTTGELRHFLGREFVCIVFTWPAGGTRGVLFGYDVDRESAEFAVEDLKKTIRMVAETSGVQKIHLLAHSRGTDLLATATADLSVEAYIFRSNIARKFKIGNIVLMAPDLDFDVAFSKIWKIVSDPDLPYGDAPRPDAVVPSPEFHITI